jgi:hypothetical protein
MNNLIFILYIIFFICLFLTNDFFIAEKLLVYLLIPAGLIPIELSGYHVVVDVKVPVFKFSTLNALNSLAYCKSKILNFVIIFGLSIVIATTITPNFSAIWLKTLIIYFFEITMFILITARLSSELDYFFEYFILLFVAIVAINASINITFYLGSLGYLTNYTIYRFVPNFGNVPDHHPVTGAMSYATGLVSATAYLSLRVKLYKKIAAIICAFIIFTAIFFTQSRGPLLGALLSLISAWIVIYRRNYWNFIFIIVFLCCIIFVISALGFNIFERLDTHRLEVWKKSFDLFLARPVNGYGERLQFVIDLSTGGQVGHAHNIFVSALLRGGIFAFLSLIAAYMLSILDTIKFANHYQNPIPLSLIVLIILSGSVDFDQLIFLPDWQWVSFWMPLGLAVASETKNFVNTNT